MPTKPKAVVLVSGGLDSAVALACAVVRDGCEAHALTFDYGQRHRCELDAAQRVAKAGGAASQKVIRVDLGSIGGSALTDRSIDVPKDRDEANMRGPSGGEGGGRVGGSVPITYVPARNLIFLSIATGYAETLGAERVYLGVNHVDYSGYPDCRPEFLAAFARAAQLATRAGAEEHGRLEICHPLSAMSKAEIILLGRSLGVALGLTHSCYDPDADGRACGRCDACVIRRRGFEQAGMTDAATTFAAADRGR